MPSLSGKQHNAENLAKRTRPMRVLSLGMSRTGTQSMAKALSILGFDRVYHGHDMGDSRREMLLWRDLWRRKHQSGPATPPTIQARNFDQILAHCGAVTDAPAALFWSELMDAYPEAKIVLVERDTEAWYKSFSSVCIDPYCSRRSSLLCLAVRLRLFPYNVLAFLPEMFMGYFRARNEREFREHARTIYEEHNASIRARAESEGREILYMSLADGFGPLCEFLDKPVPAVDFPYGNDAVSLRNTTYLGYSIFSALVVLVLIGYCALLALAVWLWQ